MGFCGCAHTQRTWQKKQPITALRAAWFECLRLTQNLSAKREREVSIEIPPKGFYLRKRWNIVRLVTYRPRVEWVVKFRLRLKHFCSVGWLKGKARSMFRVQDNLAFKDYCKCSYIMYNHLPLLIDSFFFFFKSITPKIYWILTCIDQDNVSNSTLTCLEKEQSFYVFIAEIYLSLYPRANSSRKNLARIIHGAKNWNEHHKHNKNLTVLCM